MQIRFVDLLDETLEKYFSGDYHYDAILVPGGFGTKGFESKIRVAKYARENKIPYLGICYGF